MTMRSPVQPPAMLAERRRLQQSEHSQQIDLFDGVTPTQTPAWRDLPEETRGTLTGLMARLILEHAQISSPALRPPQRIRARPSTPALAVCPLREGAPRGACSRPCFSVGTSGFSYEEAAAICESAVETIKSRANRARTRLSRQPDRFGPDQTTRAVLTAVGRG